MGRKILAADDSASIRQLVRFSLKGTDCEVVEAEDGEVALHLVRTSPVDLILTDLDMPGMDGIALTRAVRALGPDGRMPILILTTESDEAFKRQARAAGATGWITKPFKPLQLVQLVDRFSGGQGP